MIHFRDVDEKNWLAVIRLSSAEDQQNRIFEKMIASNCLSLVQASMEEGWTAQALYRFPSEKAPGFNRGMRARSDMEAS